MWFRQWTFLFLIPGLICYGAAKLTDWGLKQPFKSPYITGDNSIREFFIRAEKDNLFAPKHPLEHNVDYSVFYRNENYSWVHKAFKV